MFNRYLIIDDFYSNPEEIVEKALASTTKEEAPQGHPRGLMTTDFFLGQALRELFQKFTLEPSIVSSTDANGRILFTREGDGAVFQVHCNARMQTKWTGVIYLSKDNPAVEGTCFWKHLPTGLEVAPTTPEGLKRYGWNSFEELETSMEDEGKDESKWQKTLTIPYKFNRMVLFRPWQFHSHGPGFGDSLQSARKVQTLFFGSQQPEQRW